MQEYVRNEIVLSSGAVRDRGLCDTAAAVVGSGMLVDRLRATAEFLGACYSFFSSLEELKESGTSLLLFCDDAFSPDETVAALNRVNPEKVTVIIPLKNIPEHPTVQKYAEMELLSLMPSLHQRLRQLCAAVNTDLRVVLLDRLSGAEIDDIGLGALATEAEESGYVTICRTDALCQRSFVTVPDALAAILTVNKRGTRGNVYLASSYACTLYAVKSAVYTALAPHGVQLRLEDDPHAPANAALSYGKLSSLGYTPISSFEDTLRYTLLSAVRAPIDRDFFSSSYEGKLSALRQLQLDALKEIDRICRKHDIPYFLSGGSMLGAVRHRGYIPWDDDIDVGFLREHYERFRAVAPDELNDKFLYQNYNDRNGYHYFFDRVTAKNTYFATKYSDGYDMPKGVAVDIFVFDRAPQNARWFWQGLMNRRLVMNVRWHDTARRGKAYLLTKLLLPLFRMRSMDSYSRSYDKAVQKYRNRDTGFVLPPATDHRYKGAMPESWFSEVVPAQFEGVDSFIPKGYDAYLKIWYGDDYMTALPLCKQRSYHDYYRLDLGDHVADRTTSFDYRGELL